MNVWLRLLNNEGSLQGAEQGNRYYLHVVKSAKQKGGISPAGMNVAVTERDGLPDSAAANGSWQC